MVVGGSLSKGLVVKLDPSVSIEDMAVGRYIVVHGRHKRFFCMINDITLDNTNPSIQSDPPDLTDAYPGRCLQRHGGLRHDSRRAHALD